MAKITVQNTEIMVVSYNSEDYISLTDMAKSQLQEHIIFRWLSLKSTIEYLGEWEMLYNPVFNCTEFGTIKNMAGSNNFVLSVKTWIEKTGAIGIVSKAGRYGGTYARRDIAYHFGMWISPKFQLLLVKEYQRLKAEEQKQLGWSAKRELSKINYRIHTDAIKQNLVPVEVTAAQAGIWKYMFSPVQFNQTGRVLLRVFPNKERSTPEIQYNHSYFFNELDKINTMRNRIAHHEPVCFYLQDTIIDTTHVLGIYLKMQRLFAWMGIDSHALLYGLDHVQQVCGKINELKE